MVKITIQQKIDMALAYTGMSKNDFAKKMGTSWNAFRQRLENGKFSDSDFENIAKALGAKYHSSFTFPDGTEI